MNRDQFAQKTHMTDDFMPFLKKKSRQLMQRKPGYVEVWFHIYFLTNIHIFFNLYSHLSVSSLKTLQQQRIEKHLNSDETLHWKCFSSWV